MKNIIKYSKILFILGLTLMLSDCKKDKFLACNNNPNYPATVPPNLLLAPVEANIAYMLGNTLGIFGGLWSQYWAQDPTYGSQYGQFDAYVNVPTDNDNVWQALYTNATNTNIIITTIDSAQKNYAAIAYFMKAYEFQIITDAWGNVPCSQALQGVNKGITSPTFDPQQQVYDSIVVWIQDGMKMIDMTQTSPPEDLIYPGQSMAQWQKFANTLLLKVYLRESGVASSVASAGIQSLAGASFITVPQSASSPGSGDDAIIHYTAVTFQQFPLYATGLALEVRNITGSATCVNYMVGLNDPRLPDFYQLDANGSYGGELQGDWRNLSGSTDAGFSPPSTEVLGPNASQRFITASESLFLQAEAVSKGYLSGNAAQLYQQAILASFASWTHSSQAGNVAVATYMAQSAVAFNSATAEQQIITQKWVSMCGNQNFEAWCEWRRTGYPNFFTPSLASAQPAGAWPLRLVYPSAEINDNVNFPASVPIYTPVWWGLNL